MLVCLAAVIAALRTLQEKMRRLELERAQAEKNVQHFAEVTQKHASSSASSRATTAAGSIRAQEQPRTRGDPNSKHRMGKSVF